MATKISGAFLRHQNLLINSEDQYVVLNYKTVQTPTEILPTEFSELDENYPRVS